jgi:hypothetical protein
MAADIGSADNGTEHDMKPSNLRPLRRTTARRISGRAQQDHILDPYQHQQKLRDGTVCPECGAVYHDGRWQWTARTDSAGDERCPACRRIAERFPAGIVTLRGTLTPEQREQMISLARHEEAAEKQEHPLNRIIGIEQAADTVVISTTDVHLPRRIGEAVKRSFRGALTMDFEKDGYFIRVNWSP